MKTNDIFITAFNNSGLSQSNFAKAIGRSQPVIHCYLKKNYELRYSEFKRYMKFFGFEFDIVVKNDIQNFESKEILRKLEISLIKEFSKETDYEAKKLLDKKIEAIKIILDN